MAKKSPKTGKKKAVDSKAREDKAVKRPLSPKKEKVAKAKAEKKVGKPKKEVVKGKAPTKKAEKPAEEKVKKPAEEKPEKEGIVKKPEEKVEKPAEKKPEKKPKKEKKPKIVEKIKFYGKKVLSGEEKESIRKRFRKEKPRFLRQEFYKKKRLADKWRTPRGIDSKKRIQKRGKGKIPKIGYKKDSIASGIHPSGYYPVRVYNPQGLDPIDPKTEAIIISSGVGRKKRNEIIVKANDIGITILNPRKGEVEK